MTYLSDVTTIRNAIAAKLKAMLALAELKPSYTAGGRTWAWADYVAMLRTQLREANDDVIRATGPIEISEIGLS